MKVITYLGFTVLSIIIQFCVMDFIQDRKPTSMKNYDHNLTSQKKELTDLIKDKPHALYYRTQHMTRSLKKSDVSLVNGSTNVYNNSSLSQVPLSTTDMSATVLDVFYDENTSDMERSSTIDPFTANNEFDNITESPLFENKNQSSGVFNEKPIQEISKDCHCNFLYQVCDIHCCCDKDCTEYEHKMFNCNEHGDKKDSTMYTCISQDKYQKYGNNLFDNLFCVVKTNLPDKRTIKKYHQMQSQKYYKWQVNDHPKTLYEFKKTLYSKNDPIWLLHNETFYYLDMATPLTNNYCNDRTAMKFLNDERIICKVKFNDLEMFHILNTSKEAKIISATEKSFNSSVLNCSNLHCINWMILACDNQICNTYNKAINGPSCTRSVCTNIALRIDYNFYYYDSKIINATIKLYIQNVPNIMPFISQEINVKFFLGNKSEENIIQFSGSPGYIAGRPIIVSYSENNYTEHFYNNTYGKNYLYYPDNVNGLCSSVNVPNNIVAYGLNKRMKCRYVYANINTQNTTNMCNNIQKNLNELLGLNNKVTVSPFGNPYGLTDDDWTQIQERDPKQPVYGEYNEETSRLYCRNLITRISLVFITVNGDDIHVNQNKIVNLKYDATASNVTFNIEDVSTVLTIDINFVDISKPNGIEYAGSPHLNIHLPKDFFFPFPSNKSNYLRNSCYLIISLMLCNNVYLFK